MNTLIESNSITLKQKLKFKFILNAPLLPYLELKPENPLSTLSDYKKFTDEFLEALPKYDGLILRLHPNFKNPLPFIWNGFEVKSRFTFRIDFSQNKKPELNYKDTLKRQIKSAKKSLTIKTSLDSKNLYNLKKLDHEKRNVPLDFDKPTLDSLFESQQKKGNATILEAYKNEECVGAILYTHSEKEAIYLVGATHPDYRNSKALSLLLSEAIESTKQTSTSFDFEGSMELGIARFFSTFGAECVPYYQIENFPNKLAKAAVRAKKLLG